ncbi:MAG: hypothetical protein J5714_03855 [Alphaproteobacteria bacterium]|nr:hypothetical protein [Alphaproteobacteria bacterium]
MKAIFAESSNGYMARGPKDDMSWTPGLDKKIFSLLTVFDSGKCVCSNKTYALLPQKMLSDPARRYIIAEKTGPNSLVALNQVYHDDAILIGGPTILKEAYNLSILNTIVVTTVKTEIMADPKYKNPLADVLKNPVKRIDFGGFVISVYKTQHGKER